MSKAKRRRKASVSLAMMAVAPLVAAVSLQELGPMRMEFVSDECAQILSIDIPECTTDDFTTRCSANCHASIETLSDTVQELCSCPLFDDVFGPFISSAGELLLCMGGFFTSLKARQEPVFTTETVFTTVFRSTATDTLPPVASETPAETQPLLEPLPETQSGIQSTPGQSSNFSASPLQPTSPGRDPDAIPPVLAPTPASSTFVPPFVFPVISNRPPATSISNPPPAQLLPPATSTFGISSAILIPLPSSPNTSPASSRTAPFLLDSTVPGQQPPTTFSIRPIPLSSGMPSRPNSSPISPIQVPQSPPMQQPPPGASLTSFMLQPLIPGVSTFSPEPSQSSTSTSISPSSSSSSATSSATANAADKGGLPTAMSTDEQTRSVTPSIIGGVVGGGLAVVGGLTTLIYFLLQRRRRKGEGGRRPISSWDFIDQNRGRPTSQPSDLSAPQMSYFDQPIFFDQRVQGPAKPQEVVIQRKSGPPVRVARQSNGSMVGFDEGTVEALRMQRKTQNTMSQYSNGSIIVSYSARMPPAAVAAAARNYAANNNSNNNNNFNNDTNNNDDGDSMSMNMVMMGYGSPGPTVYNGPSQRRNENPRYKQRNNPSPIDEMLEVRSGGGSRMTFYDRVMGDPRLRNYGERY